MRSTDLMWQVTVAGYAACNLWKEINWQTFKGKRASPKTVAALASGDKTNCVGKNLVCISFRRCVIQDFGMYLNLLNCNLLFSSL